MQKDFVNSEKTFNTEIDNGQFFKIVGGDVGQFSKTVEVDVGQFSKTVGVDGGQFSKTVGVDGGRPKKIGIGLCARLVSHH